MMFTMKKNQSLNKKILKKIGLNIRYRRLYSNISQEALALDIGVERSYITSIEMGEKSPSIYCLYLLAKRLNTTLKDLLDINLE